MANYEHTTREAFRIKVQHKLGDEGIHWPLVELNSCIEEALLTFGAISGFWKEEIFINTQENKVFYDLFIDPHIGLEKIKPSIQYAKIFEWLNRDLLESISFAQPISEFLDLDFYIKSIESKYNLYQQLTNLVLTTIEHPIAANINEVLLPNNLIDIIRISFTGEDGFEFILDQADEQEIYLNSNALTEVGIPVYYSNVYGLTKAVKIHPTPANVGTIKIVYVVGKESLVIDNEEIILNLPNNLIPYIKFGVEADIFSNDGPFNDPVRAAYCKQRWEEGIMIGRNYPSALIAKANGRQIGLDSLYNVDIYSDNIKLRTPPTILGFGGFNIFRTDEIPSEVEYSLGITIITNAKIPVSDEDFIKTDLEYIDMLADYVVHLAKFRNGANEVAITSNLKDNFLKISINHNRRLLQAGITFENLIGVTKKQEIEQPRIPIEQ